MDHCRLKLAGSSLLRRAKAAKRRPVFVKKADQDLEDSINNGRIAATTAPPWFQYNRNAGAFSGHRWIGEVIVAIGVQRAD